MNVFAFATICFSSLLSGNDHDKGDVIKGKLVCLGQNEALVLGSDIRNPVVVKTRGTKSQMIGTAAGQHPLQTSRTVPSDVKMQVWNRDKGVCVRCGSGENLHFDHIIPFSRGGSSSDPKNIQVLCSKCNLTKGDRIE